MCWQGRGVSGHSAMPYIDTTALNINLATLWKVEDAHTFDSAISPQEMRIDFSTAEAKSWEKNRGPNEH